MAKLVKFIHGIGNFQPDSDSKVELLNTLRAQFPDDTVSYASYEHFLDSKVTSKVAQYMAKAASAHYMGSPVAGRLIADYGGDILQYYLSRRTTRAKISKIIINNIANDVRAEHDGLIILGHSLGSLVAIRAIALLQEAYRMTMERSVRYPTLRKELLDDPYLLADAQVLVAKSPDLVKGIKVVLLGSPAFSEKLHLVRHATHKLALRESPISKTI